MKTRSIRCMKFFLTLFNIICILFGLVLMAVCVINMRDHKSRPEQSMLSRGVLSFLLTLGLCLVATAILGCIGALREHVKLLYVHASFFIFLVSVEVIVGVGGAVLSAWVGGGNELRAQFFRNDTIEDRIYQESAIFLGTICRLRTNAAVWMDRKTMVFFIVTFHRRAAPAHTRCAMEAPVVRFTQTVSQPRHTTTSAAKRFSVKRKLSKEIFS
ncbi:hypothetical protein ACJJTC_008439 [Scirpophaga incertulas]